MTYGPSTPKPSPDALASHGAHHDDHGPYAPVFAAGTAPRAELDELLTRYPNKMAGLLPALWIVQRERGWVSDEAMAEVADALDLTAAYVKGVVTFYTMYHQHPVGKYFIQVCTTTPCHVCGAEGVVDAFLQHTGCGELGVTSADGRYTVIEVECLGACGFATPVMINEQFLESVTPQRVPEILAALP
ncbi:NAD(P)H-dependent oxidoreductase subunit E [Roseisolibacter sp. H3M3-2]|uniref:NADH-quinone oxidoreductase subunit NuoE family protein n=1 Tax=Roseisolibacter sp. H3M3-2 TaxID=3031323 RepID=UPI0023DBD58A|nr:NAD(P)H-dependent oxidoreductase subunit E [Roseisolibacter sp. H3M3-2]MDF1501471.1 NAD(P)H-dependent oxidoreductase subunit E [Roseisolibacter sp. H3M3-2]